jgi:two-component system NarL family sensor kinase
MEHRPVSPVFYDGSPTDSPRNPESLAAHESAFAVLEAQPQPAFIDVFQQIINGLSEQIALVDDQWVILGANPSWMRTAAMYGYDALRPGANYLEFCTAMAKEGHTAASIVAEGIREMERSGQMSFRFTYHGNDRWEGHAFQICINRFEVAGRRYATTTRYDVTELVHLREMREEFSHSLIEHQAEERRRMAREVHDSTMQLLAGVGLSLGQLKHSRSSKATGHIVEEMEQLLGEAQRELRTISYLAHAPQVNELGLTKALRQLAGGFGRRTGLNIALNVDEELRLSPAEEVAIYRMVQEALSNVHRHAHATDITIGMFRRRSVLHVAVADNGIGMPRHVRNGVGLSSMRARIEELGGRLMIRSENPGTILIASMPTHAEIRPVGDLSVAAHQN